MRHCLLLLFLLATTGCGGGSSGGSGASGGLSQRPDNPDCVAFSPLAEVRLTPIAPDLSFNAPTQMIPHPSLADIFYVLEQSGTVYRLNLANNQRSAVVDLADSYTLSRCDECGLLGVAFDPDFAQNGFLYLSFTEGSDRTPTSVVARFETSDNGQRLRRDGAGNLLRTDLLSQRQPFANHNGGHIAFGPDRRLYIGLGDGGSANDPGNRAQDLSTRLGKILTLNADGSPSGNDVSGAVPEIFAYGLRNPWRWSFDRQTGDLWAGDVGENRFEEINRITRGGNYGWRCFEGFEETGNSCENSGPFVEPVSAYGRGDGVSVTGGYVYRGTSIPALQGSYLFADFGSGTLWALAQQQDGSYQRRTLLETGYNVASFGEGRDGELYLVTFQGLFRIDPVLEDTELPEQLSETGCVQASAPWQPADGLIPYTVIEPFWSDGADKTRYFALPDNTTITVDETGDFEFPRGTVLVKNFSLDQRRIETRLYLHNSDGSWSGYSYRWDEAGSDATLVAGGLDVDLGGQVWHYPSAGECTLCHTSAAGNSLGLEVAQLNRSFTYPQTGRTANQLDTYAAIGLFRQPPTSSQRQRTLTRSTDTEAALADRARSYLHTNCSHCHRPGGTTQSNMDLRITTPLGQTGACEVEPRNGDLGQTGAVLLRAGDAVNSLLYLRMVAGQDDRMPPISVNVVDRQGAELIEDWINQLESCN
ncbi:PQQ-dependent sugar dehydrogenase [Marinobacter salinisoli]|uniref:PQQ-dependent sugar dehydrogenase n=1 Tax=Marinobacter salinisoli TaxID=2769486 RepID=A0ABX7MSY0_9GAMM|nr:PQQ-dependent sugar dehydrogenase [Marinobacter salinisoli]QSP95475.1 PQQ-dependent sugar dehydrogenase [Marinobacter salinisoli]